MELLHKKSLQFPMLKMPHHFDIQCIIGNPLIDLVLRSGVSDVMFEPYHYSHSFASVNLVYLPYLICGLCANSLLIKAFVPRYSDCLILLINTTHMLRKPACSIGNWGSITCSRQKCSSRSRILYSTQRREMGRYSLGLSPCLLGFGREITLPCCQIFGSL